MAQNISKANLQSALLKNNIKLKEYINNSISAINQFNVVILTDSNLPTDDIKERTIYMLPDPSSTEENNIYIEYLYIKKKNSLTIWGMGCKIKVQKEILIRSEQRP